MASLAERLFERLFATESVLRERLEKWPDERRRDSDAAHDPRPRGVALFPWRSQLAEVDHEVVLPALDEREVRIDTDIEFGRKFNLDLLNRFIGHVTVEIAF